MQEIQIAGRRLSTIDAQLRALKVEAAKVILDEMKKVKGCLANLRDETDINSVNQFAAKAIQHAANAVTISKTVGIPVFDQVRDRRGRFLFWSATMHPYYDMSPELLQLGADLAIIETNPANWA